MLVTSSPCVSICQVDPLTGHCVGCGRTVTEIGRWAEMTEPDRLAVMAALPARFETLPRLSMLREQAVPRQRLGRRRFR